MASIKIVVRDTSGRTTYETTAPMPRPLTDEEVAFYEAQRHRTLDDILNDGEPVDLLTAEDKAMIVRIERELSASE